MSDFSVYKYQSYKKIKCYNEQVMKKFLFILTIIGLFLYGFFIEPSLLLVKTKDVYLPNLNPKLDGVKIGVVADLHIGTTFVNLEKVDKVIKKVNSYNTDLIFLLGDLDAKSISRHYNEEQIIEKLNKFHAKYGVISILGNHDYEPENIIRDITLKSNVSLLENETKNVQINGVTLRVVGFKDLWHHYLNPGYIIGNDNKTSTIVLAHNPDSFPDVPNFVCLTLSGHTHGGEVCIPVFGSITVPSKYGDKYRKGYIVENGKHLYVSGGVATLSHLRFCNPPEITILTIHPQTEKTKIENTGLKKHIRKSIL